MYLDAGTNNQTYLNDPLYLGLRRPRPSTEELYAFVDEFVEAVQEVFPSCCIHFEDWTGSDAVRLLARYRDKVCCYNDDIQGTGSVTLAGLLAALKVTGGKIRDQRILFLGAGSAAIGLAGLIASAMVQEGPSLKEAQARISMFDINGLLEPSRTDLFDFQKPYAHSHSPTRDFVAAIESLKPTMLIGVSTVGNTFTRQVIEAMSRLNDRPIIFALSNPTERAECTPEAAYQWSRGKALYAAGVQFPPVSYGGRTFLSGQANNFYIFPAVGMAIYATQAKRVTDEMFIEAAHALADQVTRAELEQGLLFPPQSNILETEIKVAARVAKVVFDSDLARVARPADCEAFIRSHVCKPEYRNLV
jgi:malate dehydrogenase (oxaloacetate-decarboxylating)(NADP+)